MYYVRQVYGEFRLDNSYQHSSEPITTYPNTQGLLEADVEKVRLNGYGGSGNRVAEALSRDGIITFEDLLERMAQDPDVVKNVMYQGGDCGTGYSQVLHFYKFWRKQNTKKLMVKVDFDLPVPISVTKRTEVDAILKNAVTEYLNENGIRLVSHLLAEEIEAQIKKLETLKASTAQKHKNALTILGDET